MNFTAKLSVLLVASLLSGASCGFVESGARYFVQHYGGRSSCTKEAEFLGYLNKTCSAGTGLGPTEYGPTVGPILRAASAGKQWKEWEFTVVGQAADGSDLVTIHTYYPSQGSKQPLCEGYMVPEKPAACLPPQRFADKVHIHPKGPVVWKVTQVKGDAYTIVAQSRGAPCLKFLGGAAQCSDKYTQLYAKDDGSGQQWWIITPVKPPSPSPKPKPSPSPMASPPPTAVASPPPPVVSPPPAVSPQAAPPAPCNRCSLR